MHKIISYNNVTAEGLELEFEEPVALNGVLKTNKWWVSWDRLSLLISNGIAKEQATNN